MTARGKSYALGLGALGALAMIAYFWGAGRGASQMIYEGERIGLRSYGCFVIPDPADNLVGRFRMLKWRITNPGHARILPAWARVEKKSPTGFHSPQQVLEELRFRFPPGCFARAGIGGSTDIAHYPSVLARIENALSLQPIRTNALPKAISHGLAQSVEPTRGSRFCPSVLVRQQRLPSVAHAWRWPI